MLAELLFEKTSSFMTEVFEDRTLKQYYANAALESLEIEELAEDSNNLTKVMVEIFAPEKDGIL